MSLPQMYDVQSSNVQSVGHDGSDLYVRFHRSGVYRYRGVPAASYEELRKADSVGKFLNGQIKPTYLAEKV